MRASLEPGGAFSLAPLPTGDYYALVMKDAQYVGRSSELRTLLPGATLDLGTITVLVFAKLTVRVRSEHAATPLTVAIRHEGRWKEVREPDSGPLEFDPFRAGTWDLLVWGEAIAPMRLCSGRTSK